MAESKEKLKSLLMKVKEQSEKAGLKPRKNKITASGPIPSRQINGKKVEAMTEFIFLGSKILQTVTAAMKLKDSCSLEEKLWET